MSSMDEFRKRQIDNMADVAQCSVCHKFVCRICGGYIEPTMHYKYPREYAEFWNCWTCYKNSNRYIKNSSPRVSTVCKFCEKDRERLNNVDEMEKRIQYLEKELSSSRKK